MKILIDTNILFSAILNENSRVAKTLFYVSRNHELYLSDQNIYELKEIVRRKIPEKIPIIKKLLENMEYKVVSAIKDDREVIRDAKDQPILNAAIDNDLDIILTGDKDFLDLKLKHPRCMGVGEFCEKEGIEEF